jgi:methylglutaconyl-CoA hydratase
LETFQTIKRSTNRNAATIWLTRPEKRNAIDAKMAVELPEALEAAAADDDISVLILRGEGSSFCAGADLNWMNSSDLPVESQPEKLLPKLFKSIFYFPKPLIVVVQGTAMGGALGLIAAGDFVLAADDARFAFSEVRLGLVPATISPFVVRRTGEYKARQLMLRGSAISAEDAMQAGLADFIVPATDIEDEIKRLCQELEKNGPKAMRTCKEMLLHVAEHRLDDKLMAYTAEILEKIRSGNEAREGMKAFIEKRDAVWRQK